MKTGLQREVREGREKQLGEEKQLASEAVLPPGEDRKKPWPCTPWRPPGEDWENG